MTERTPETPPSDVYANPQDTEFGRSAAEDQERVDRGEQPTHDPSEAPRPGGKAEPQ